MTSDTRVSVLTPPGTGAIATIEVAGPRAWEIARQLFQPAGSKPLPEVPERHRFWFGRMGDEVILAVKEVEPEPRFEIHGHGGRRVVRWLVEQVLALGGVEVPPNPAPTTAVDLLPFAPTLRTAAILLDQMHGAFDRALAEILAHPDSTRDALAELVRFAPLGRHLVAPWKVCIAGAPNVGKSSLVNALAGYQRAIVSEVPGTTRDVVTVAAAFEGWPVELADTAGLREAAGLEAAGIARAEEWIRAADLVVWVLDATAPEPVLPESAAGLLVINKCDQPAAWDAARFPDALRISAATGEGVPGLAAAIARTLVPHPPPPGAAVPFTPQLADMVEALQCAQVGTEDWIRAAAGLN